MPELPEVQQVRATLGPRVIGRAVSAVTVRRADVIHGDAPDAIALLAGDVIADIARHGKQLALIGQRTGRCVCVHLGMTGSLQWRAGATGDAPDVAGQDRHVHVVWTLGDGSRFIFRDPRRFGGLWPYGDRASLETARWGHLGPDALTIQPARLLAALHRTQRPLKAALLDQRLVAGLGNIYVDEALHAAGLHPLTPGQAVTPDACRRLTRHIKAILQRAIASGGSTIRNYVDGQGRSGQFQQTLRVYGRAGQPCRSCQRPLTHQTVIGRTTTFCQYCQGGLA